MSKKKVIENMLTIEISDDRKISDIQKEFNEKFPYLKLEFLHNATQKKEGSDKIISDSSKKVFKLSKSRSKRQFIIHPKQTVVELENAFKEYFGLCVQLYRKSGRTWLQSTITDDWTLKEQNEHGEALSNFNIEKK